MPNARDIKAKTKPKFFLLGDTGSGKTTQFLTLPGKKFMYLFDANAILSLQGHDVDYEEYYPDRLNLSVKSLTKGKGDNTTNLQSDIYQRWEKDFDEKVKSGFFDQYDVIGFDSATTLLDLIMDRVLTVNGRAGSWPQQDDYGPQMSAFINISRTLTSLNKIIYMTGHLETKKDELVGRIFRQPVMTGRLKLKIPLLFSDIFVCEVEAVGGKVKHKLMTAPDRITTTVRTSFKTIKDGWEDVSIDFSKPLEGQGLGGMMRREGYVL